MKSDNTQIVPNEVEAQARELWHMLGDNSNIDIKRYIAKSVDLFPNKSYISKLMNKVNNNTSQCLSYLYVFNYIRLCHANEINRKS